MTLPFKPTPAHFPYGTLVTLENHEGTYQVFYAALEQTYHGPTVLQVASIEHVRQGTVYSDHSALLEVPASDVTRIIKRGKLVYYPSPFLNDFNTYNRGFRWIDFVSRPSKRGSRYRLTPYLGKYLVNLAKDHLHKLDRVQRLTCMVRVPSAKQLQAFEAYVTRTNVLQERFVDYLITWPTVYVVDQRAANRWVSRNLNRLLTGITLDAVKAEYEFTQPTITPTEDVLQNEHSDLFDNLFD